MNYWTACIPPVSPLMKRLSSLSKLPIHSVFSINTCLGNECIYCVLYKELMAVNAT